MTAPCPQEITIIGFFCLHFPFMRATERAYSPILSLVPKAALVPKWLPQDSVDIGQLLVAPNASLGEEDKCPLVTLRLLMGQLNSASYLTNAE